MKNTAKPLMYTHEVDDANQYYPLFPLPGKKEDASGKNSQPKLRLCLPSLRGFQVVEICDIIYCEASSNYTYFHFINRPTICTAKSIYEYESLLNDSHFIRIHRSFLVNPEHIREYIRGEGGYVILSNNDKIEVARRKKDLLMKKMKEYFKF